MGLKNKWTIKKKGPSGYKKHKQVTWSEPGVKSVKYKKAAPGLYVAKVIANHKTLTRAKLGSREQDVQTEGTI